MYVATGLSPSHWSGWNPAWKCCVGAVSFFAGSLPIHRLMALINFFSPRYLLEHGLKHDGRLDPEAPDIGDTGSFETFFTETGNGKYVPRSIFVDLDPSVSPRCA